MSSSLLPFFLAILLPHIVPSLFTSSANELTVGKVYAALMIFDYYKQNRARRLQQQQQQSSSGSQVQHPEHTCPHTTHTDWSTHIPDGAVQTYTHAPTYSTLAHTDIHSGCVSACIHTCKEGTFVSTCHSLVDYQRYQLLSLFNIFIIKDPGGWLPAKWAALMAFEPATARGTCIWLPARGLKHYTTFKFTVQVHVCFPHAPKLNRYAQIHSIQACLRLCWWIFWPKSPHLGGTEPPLPDLDPAIFCLLPLNVFSMLPSVSPPQCKVGALFKPLLPLTHMQEKDLPMMFNSVEPPSILQPQSKSHAKSQPQTRPSSNSLNNGGTL